VSGDLVPERELRLSDAERDGVVDLLHRAVTDGRLTLAEFEERVARVLAARTRAEVAPYVADLPAAPVPDVMALRAESSSLRRTGRWSVPGRIVVSARSASVKLDLTDAVIRSATVEVELDAGSSSVTLVLPPGATADASAVAVRSSSTSIRIGAAGGGPHVVVSGRAQSSSLRIRHRWRFLRWEW